MSRFRITYDGPALAGHRMDVRELAPALLAAGDLLDAATRALHGDRVRARTEVHASFRTGSFGIDFALAADWVRAVRDLFAGESATASANALAILGALGLLARQGRVGLLQLLGRLRGRRIQHVDMGQRSARLYVDKDIIEVELAVLTLLRDVQVRQALEKLLEPLGRDGIDSFASGDDAGFAVVVAREQRGWYAVPELEDALLLQEERRAAFSIVSLAFREDNKWRLSDGVATHHAAIADKEFLDRVDRNIETFAKGDTLICLVRLRQWQTPTGVRTEYEIERVHEHRAPLQPRLV